MESVIDSISVLSGGTFKYTEQAGYQNLRLGILNFIIDEGKNSRRFVGKSMVNRSLADLIARADYFF